MFCLPVLVVLTRAAFSVLPDLRDPERLVQCPYDKHHQIRACRFPYHLVKCRKVRCRVGTLRYVTCMSSSLGKLLTAQP